MPEISYTNPALVTGTAADDAARPNPYATGYGSKIPTRHKVHYDGYWRRVYVMQYSNAGSAYILVRGKEIFLDTGTEHALEAA